MAKVIPRPSSSEKLEECFLRKPSSRPGPIKLLCSFAPFSTSPRSACTGAPRRDGKREAHNKRGETPLMWAAMQQQLDCVKLLLQAPSLLPRAFGTVLDPETSLCWRSSASQNSTGPTKRGLSQPLKVWMDIAFLAMFYKMSDP